MQKFLRYTDPRPGYLNLGSYNYLGFAQNNGPCADDAVEALTKYGCATSSPVSEIGTWTDFYLKVLSKLFFLKT